ncbi:hypothetical protein NPX13_g10719 [Xylaria arbuscula]|uniref:Uncharacterized protein n=1 Tax=Xylaria arbuscula TaxID=114810 RepID=A0A9W8N483_9PEZI|nr:hypothetical protein NPX13_g10719 [Xylaria arbuscula]
MTIRGHSGLLDSPVTRRASLLGLKHPSTIVVLSLPVLCHGWALIDRASSNLRCLLRLPPDLEHARSRPCPALPALFLLGPGLGGLDATVTPGPGPAHTAPELSVILVHRTSSRNSSESKARPCLSHDNPLDPRPPPPASPEMQVLDTQNQNHVEGHPDLYTLYPHQGFGDSAFYDINAIDQSLWSPHTRTWHTDDFAASHEAIDNFVHLQQQQQQQQQQQHVRFAMPLGFRPTSPVSSLISPKQHQQPPPPIDGTDNADGHHVLDFHAPFVDWQSVVSFDTAFDKYKARATPLDSTIYPPTPQTLLTPLPATSQPLKEATLHDGMLSPVSPRSPEGVQTDQKKRNRNRLRPRNAGGRRSEGWMNYKKRRGISSGKTRC